MFRKGLGQDGNFDTVWWIINETKKRMLKAINNAIAGWSNNNQNMEILPSRKKKNLSYAGFEIFTYLLYWLWKLIRQYQNEEVGKRLFDYLYRKIYQTTKMEEAQSRKVIDLRLKEYEDILSAETKCGNMFSELGSSRDENRNRVLYSFLENLACSITKEDCFSLYGTERTIALLDSHILFSLHLTYKKVIYDIDNAFIFFTDNILKANPDITKLSLEELWSIEDTTLSGLGAQSVLE